MPSVARDNITAQTNFETEIHAIFESTDSIKKFSRPQAETLLLSTFHRR
jgi:hypothetical protein